MTAEQKGGVAVFIWVFVLASILALLILWVNGVL